MAERKRYVMLGLGSFGSALAIRLSENGCRVTGVDADPERADTLKDKLYEAITADVTDRQALVRLLLPNAEAVFISLGEDLTQSILATLHARELGAKRIMVKGISQEHGKILEALGVERVIFPEEETAHRLADQISGSIILNFLPIDSEYSFIEIGVPAKLSGQTLIEADLRRRYGIWVLGVRDVLNNKLEVLPRAEYRLTEDQLLLLIATKESLDRFREAYGT